MGRTRRTKGSSEFFGHSEGKNAGHSSSRIAWNATQIQSPPSGDTTAAGQFGRPSGQSVSSPLSHVKGVARGVGKGKPDTSDGP